MKGNALLFATLCCGAPWTFADLVTPASSVQQFVTVRDSAQEGREVARLLVGQRAELLDSTATHHRIRLANGTEGYVLRRYTRTFDLNEAPAPQQGELALHFIDVGQGDATLVVCPDRSSLLIDAGTASRVDPALSHYLADTLGADQGRLNTVIVTHPDPEHDNLLPALLRGYSIRRVLHAGATEDYDNDEFTRWLQQQDGVRRLSTSDISLEAAGSTQLECGGARVQILSAAQPATADWRDNLSIVLRIEYGDFTAILPGDAGVDVENAILQRFSPAFLDVDLLKVADGGTQGESNSPAWLAATQPEISVISNLANNEAGAPNGTLVMQLQNFAAPTDRQMHPLSYSYQGLDVPRWQRANALNRHVYTTADSGTVVVTSDGSGFEVRTAR